MSELGSAGLHQTVIGSSAKGAAESIAPLAPAGLAATAGRAAPDAPAAAMRPAIVAHITTVPQSLRFLTGQVGYMKARGFTVHALSSPGPLLQQFGVQEEVPVFAVPMSRRLTPIRDLRALYAIWRWLRRVRPDIVHAHTPKGGLLGMIAAKLAQVPVRMYHMRGLPYLTAGGFRRWLLRRTEWISCRLAQRVVCVSRSLMDVAVDDGLCVPERIHVLAHGSGNGVDSEQRFNPTRQTSGSRAATRSRYDIPEQALLVGFIGRLVRDKGIVDLARAWSRVRRLVPQAYLLLVGELEEQDPLPASTLLKLQRDPRVRLIGQEWDTPPLYAALDLLVLPTHREGFPNVLLEAAAMALPVVATRVTGCIDAVLDGATGRLVPVSDPEALAEAVIWYLTHPVARREHGEAGRSRVVRDFRPEQIWQSLEQDYRSLLSAHQPAGGTRPSSSEWEGVRA